MNHRELFRNCIVNKSGCGSYYGFCKCGRTYYQNNPNLYSDCDENEKSVELEKHISESLTNKNIIITEEFTSILSFNGCNFVRGCECKWEDKYADFLMQEKDVILSFYKRLKKELITDALEIEKKMEGVE